MLMTNTSEYVSKLTSRRTTSRRITCLNVGNYLEPQAISARHGACGDPGQVTGALFACTLL